MILLKTHTYLTINLSDQRMHLSLSSQFILVFDLQLNALANDSELETVPQIRYLLGLRGRSDYIVLKPYL